MFIDKPVSLPESFKTQLRDRKVNWGFGPFSEAVYARTYSRVMPDGRQERWADTVIRTVEGSMSILSAYSAMSKDQIQSYGQDLAVRMFDLQVLAPGRGLWAGGTQKVYEIGSAALNNCGFVTTKNLVEAAGWAMDHLMLGVGVGFDTEFSAPMYENRSETAYNYPIADSREGWVRSLQLLLNSYLSPNTAYVAFDYSYIRPKGAPIRGFGGTASGPEPLEEMHRIIRQQCEAYARQEITSTQLVVDIMNLIGRCVVAGNVRRSAEIALGKPDDPVFRTLKDPALYPDRNDWNTGWGHLSNNSVILKQDSDFEMLESLVPTIISNGEPGFLNMQAIQKFGRTGKQKPDLAIGANPCSEIPLESGELCNLVEVFPTRCETIEDIWDCLRLGTIYATAISLLPSHSSLTNEVVGRNHRIGVSMSGLADWKDQIGIPRMTRILRDGYALVEAINLSLLRPIGFNPSVRLTTVKPSGTVSQLAGVSSGMHHPWDRWSLRRMRVASDSPIVELLVKAGVPFEPDVKDVFGTLVFEFPIEFGGGRTRSQSDVSMWEQSAFVAMLQRDWADNMVSNTISFQPEEESQLSYAMGMFAPVVKSMSFLPDFNAYAEKAAKETGEYVQPYAQPPYERISREEYRRRKAAISDIDWTLFEGSDGQDSKFCTDDFCEISL